AGTLLATRHADTVAHPALVPGAWLQLPAVATAAAGARREQLPGRRRARRPDLLLHPPRLPRRDHQPRRAGPLRSALHLAGNRRRHPGSVTVPRAPERE